MTDFQSLGLADGLLQAITQLGFETPTPIQAQVIPKLLNDRSDIVALAQTGTGKTAAFGLPLVSLSDIQSKTIQGLVLCPTRELCLQITRDLQNFSKFTPGYKVVPVYGGANILTQMRSLKEGAHVVVATPGRLVDLISRRAINLQSVRFVVLDEADEMLNMGFKEDLDTILEQVPSQRNTWLFSATMSEEVARISSKYMNQPAQITVGSKNQGNDNIQHLYYQVNSQNKFPLLRRIIHYYPDIYAIIFCRTKRDTQQLSDDLKKEGYQADCLHGDLSQAQRDQVMKGFRQKTIKLLIATDVAARGLDVNNVTHVIHYSLPDDMENYVHRAGRTARGGKKGISIAFVHRSDIQKLRPIEKALRKTFEIGTVPTPQQVFDRQWGNLLVKLNAMDIEQPVISQALAYVKQSIGPENAEELLLRFVAMSLEQFLNDDQPLEAGSPGERNGERAGKDFSNLQKFKINLGEYDGFDRDLLKEYVAEVAGISKQAVAWVMVRDIFSEVDVEMDKAEAVARTFEDHFFKGRKVKAIKTTGRPRSFGGDRSERSNSGDYNRESNHRGGGDRSERSGSRDDRGGGGPASRGKFRKSRY